MAAIHLPPSGLADDILPDFIGHSSEIHLVTFNLDEEFGVPINQVYEIIRIGSITTVPNAPSYMEGVINLRGRVLPVLNLRKRLGLPEKESNKESRIIVTEINNKVVGLLVDAVSHVIKVPPELIENAPEEVIEVDTDYITGVAKLEDRLVILLDLEKLLRKEKIEIKEGGDYGEES
ncbi:MAG: chemotaxis protein CheW [Nitrospirota bacterium]